MTNSGFATTSGATVLSYPVSAAVYPVLQAQDGSYYGADGNGNMIRFSQYGNTIWSVPNDSPQIATADGGVVGASGIVYDSNGNAIGQIGNTSQGVAASDSEATTVHKAAAMSQSAALFGNAVSVAESWLADWYETATGNVNQLLIPPVPPATPPYASFLGANQSANNTSPLCHDIRDALIVQYGSRAVGDSYFSPTPIPGTDPPQEQYPRFIPNCFELTDSAHSVYFEFSEINTPHPSVAPQIGWALVKKPLVVPASSGYGLDLWRQLYGSSRIINSGYREPAQDTNNNSRHMLGDAVDLRNQTCPVKSQPCSDVGVEEWQNMVIAAGGEVILDKNGNFDVRVTHTTGARADYIEPEVLENGQVGCGLSCTHADWRFDDYGIYAH